MHADSSAATVPTVTMGPCAILIMVVMEVSVNLAQEEYGKDIVGDTSPNSELLNAKVFAIKVSLSCKIFLSGVE